MSNISVIPPGVAAPFSNLTIHGSVIIDGVMLDLRYSHEAMTHVVVGASDAITGQRVSWLGWATTTTEVPQHEVRAVAARLGRELLDFSNTEQIVVEGIEELRRMHRHAEAESKRAQDRDLRDHYKGVAIGLAGALPLIEVLADRLGVGLAMKAHALQDSRNAAEPKLTFAQGVAAIAGAIAESLGDRAELAVVVIPDAAVA